MRLKIIPAEPGAAYGGRVVNAETGEEIEELVCITYVHRAGDIPRVILEIGTHNSAVVIEGEMVGEQTEE